MRRVVNSFMCGKHADVGNHKSFMCGLNFKVDLISFLVLFTTDTHILILTSSQQTGVV